ncbi:MAG: hypothetical protein A2202_01395 [Bdellovibrionales bacterium RIFOXYA1_FULL_36_14]|nr:MAG: hypothetical protein A2202_01395 [Bdellovibrionales bacterium RIFOXYA1_FULL_36_14]
MKKLSLFIIFLGFISGIMAEEIVSVASLSGGACFVYDGEGDQKLAKIASFNQSLSWVVDESTLQKLKEDINTVLFKYGFEFLDNKYELYIHCGGYGASLVFNINMKGFHACAWTQMSDKTFVLRNLAVTSKPGPCHGQIPGRLVIYTTGDEGTDFVEKELSDPSWRKMINYVAAGGYGKVTVFLTEEYTFSEHKVQKALLESFDQQYVKYVELENLYHPIGDFKLLESLSVN